MPTLLTTPKDPNDIDDLVWEWASRLSTGETISTFSAALASGDVTVGSTAISGTDTTARISAGTADTSASVRGRIVTNTGRQIDWTIQFRVKEQ